MKTVYKNLIIIFILLLGVFRANSLFSQEPDNLLWLLEENRIEEIKQKIPEVQRRYPDSPTVLYITALLETDAKKAVDLYRKIYENHPQNRFADDALLRLGQYDFAQGLYVGAVKKFSTLIRKYPDSQLCDDALYMKVQCFQAQSLPDSTASVLKILLEDFSRSPFAKMAREELRNGGQQWANGNINNQSRPEIEDSASEDDAKYSIQVGAFKNSKNAERLQRAIQKDDFFVEIRTKEKGSDTYYLVWVGKFSSESEGLEFGQDFRKRYGLPFRVVKR